MKRIKAAKMGTICVPTEETDLTLDMKAIEEARGNKLHVIEGALSIERQLAHIIAHYFFGSSHERKPAFQSLVLESDWCSFAAKRKLVNYIINEQALLKGNDKSNFDKLLRKV